MTLRLTTILATAAAVVVFTIRGDLDGNPDGVRSFLDVTAGGHRSACDHPAETVSAILSLDTEPDRGRRSGSPAGATPSLPTTPTITRAARSTRPRSTTRWRCSRSSRTSRPTPTPHRPTTRDTHRSRDRAEPRAVAPSATRPTLAIGERTIATEHTPPHPGGERMHLRVQPGGTPRHAMLPGDPGRLPLVAECWDEARGVGHFRGFLLMRSRLGGVDLGACSTEIGAPSTDVAVDGLSRCGVDRSSAWAPAPRRDPRWRRASSSSPRARSA